MIGVTFQKPTSATRKVPTVQPMPTRPIRMRPNTAARSALLAQAQTIEQAARVANRFRIRREQLVQTMATAHGRPPSTTLLRLVPDFPSDVHAMFESLIKEVNRLVHETRRIARQNQRLLARTVELHRETLRALRPDVFSPTYDRRGGLREGSGSGSFATAV